jgi:hypothetical protein
MKYRFFSLMILACLLGSLAGAGPARAQAPERDEPPPTPVGGPAARQGDPRLGYRAEPQAAYAGNIEAQTLTLGEPGLSYRYVDTYGEDETAYFTDSTHLNYPYGMGTAGSNVWIGELFGARAMKYSNSGAVQQSIGNPGFGYMDSTTLFEITDVGVDASGNVWVVDDYASHVAKFNSSGVFQSELGSIWNSGTGNYNFQYPQSVAFDGSGNIYVSDGAPWWSVDEGNHRIQVYNSSGTYLATIGATGVPGTANNRFHGPRHITISGNLLYVADSGNHRVQILDISNLASPSYVGTLGTTGASGADVYHLDQPSGVAVASGWIYVADRYNDRVQVFDMDTYDYVTTLGSEGTGNYGLSEPFDVAIDESNYLYVADFGNTRVQKYELSLFSYQGTFGTTGVAYVTDDYHFNRPYGVYVIGDGSIYLTEGYGSRLIKLNAAGVPLWTVGQAGNPGMWTLANDRFDGPVDVAVDGDGYVYVADMYNGRVQVFDSDGNYSSTLGDFGYPAGVDIAPNGNLLVADSYDSVVYILDMGSYVGVLGQSGVPGSGNNQFDGPMDAVVDSSGNIYVADANNNRVQVFDSSYNYLRTIGTTGSCGDAFDHLCGPRSLAVDSSGRLFIADQWNNRVEVFDSSGAYLTTIGGDWGSKDGQMRSPSGVAVDSYGNVFVADSDNHRIQKFAVGVPDWTQVNINGFGDRWNSIVSALEPFGGQLYAATVHYLGTQLWRSSDGKTWSSVMTGGFGTAANYGTDHLLKFNGQLYAGTWNCADDNCNTSNGGQIWRSPDGTTWTEVVSGGFSDPVNGEIYSLAEFGNKLYAATWTYDDTVHGGEVWRSDSGDSGTWSRVVSNGFNGDTQNWAVRSFATMGGYLYAGTQNTSTGGEVWRTSNGTSWTQVNTDGFGDADSYDLNSLAVFGGRLYAGIGHASGAGAEIWRCQTCDGTDWTQVADNGLGDPATRTEPRLEPFGGRLFLVVRNRVTGIQVWLCRTCDGTDWTQVGFAGLGDSNNQHYADLTAVFADRLYIGTDNRANGGEVWAPTLPTRHPKSDFDADWQSDMAYFHPATGLWGVLKSGEGFSYSNAQFFTWGQTNDIVVPGDYDGDGLLDPTVRRPPGGGQSAAYLILKSSTNYDYGQSLTIPAGWPGLGDTPVPGDYNGDGISDPAIWRGSAGVWIIPMSPAFNTYQFFSWGLTGDTPVGADVDGDGQTDIGYLRPSTGVWGFLLSTENYSYASPQFFSWGTTGDLAVMADYDGDGKADPAVVIPPAGGQSKAYRILLSTLAYAPGSSLTIPAGWPGLGDTPVPQDYDGDGKADAGIWRNSAGVWIIPKSSTNNTQYMFAAWGASGDQIIK